MKNSRIITVVVLVLIFCALAWSINTSGMIAFEGAVYQQISSLANPALTKLVIAVTNLGSHLGVITAMAILILLPSTRMSFGVPIMINAAITAPINLILKVIIARPRPEVLHIVAETGYGFPSGHAMNNAAFYAMLALLIFASTKNIRVKVVAAVFSATIIFLIGVSRIYLGVHNTADVLAGWVLGIAIALCTQAVWQWIKDKGKPTKI